MIIVSIGILHVMVTDLHLLVIVIDIFVVIASMLLLLVRPTAPPMKRTTRISVDPLVPTTRPREYKN